MSNNSLNKEVFPVVAVVKKVRDYSEEPAFKKKAAQAADFVKKKGLPQGVTKKKR